MHLFEALAQHIAAWQEDQYKHDDYPAIGEILEWVRNPDVPTFRLRAPQIRALETYWYLRLVENTPETDIRSAVGFHSTLSHRPSANETLPIFSYRR